MGSALDALLIAIRTVLFGGNPVTLPPKTPPSTLLNFASGASGVYNASTGAIDVTITATASGPDGQNPITLVNGLNSNVAVSSSVLQHVTGPSAAFSVGGISFAGGTQGGGQRVSIVNTTTQPMTIVHEDTSSTAANRINTQSGVPFVLLPKQSAVQLQYDATSQRWVLQGTGANYGTWLNVLSFGADKSGATDSTTAINAALTSAASAPAGATVFLPAGTYKHNAPLAIPSGVTFGGDTRGSTILQQTTSGQESITITDASDVTVRDLSLQSAGSANVTHTKCVALATMARNTFERVKVLSTNFGVAGTAIQSVSGGNTINASGHTFVNGDTVQFSAATTGLINAHPIFAAAGNTISLPGGVAHGLTEADPIQFNDNFSGTLPSPLTPFTTYFAKNTGGPTGTTFQVSATSGGAAIAFTGTNVSLPNVLVWPRTPMVVLAGTATFTAGSTTVTFTNSQTIPAQAIIEVSGRAGEYYALASAVSGTTGTLTQGFKGPTTSGLTVTTGLQPFMEYFVVGASAGVSFQVAAVSGGTALPFGTPAASCKASKVYAGFLVDSAGQNVYDQRINQCSVDGGNGNYTDGGSRCGVRSTTSTGSLTVVHCVIHEGEFSNLKSGIVAAGGEIFSTDAHVYNCSDGTGGGTAYRSVSSYSLFAKQTRIESSFGADERAMVLGPGTFGCWLEAPPAFLAYQMIDFGGGNSYRLSLDANTINRQAGAWTMGNGFYQDVIKELTNGHGVQVGNWVFPQSSATVTAAGSINMGGTFKIRNLLVDRPDDSANSAFFDNGVVELFSDVYQNAGTGVAGTYKQSFGATTTVGITTATATSDLPTLLSKAAIGYNSGAANLGAVAEWTAVARCTGGASGNAGDTATFTRLQGFSQTSATSSLQGTAQTVASDSKPGTLATLGAPSFSIVGTGMRITGTGIASVNITWSFSVEWKAINVSNP